MLVNLRYLEEGETNLATELKLINIVLEEASTWRRQKLKAVMTREGKLMEFASTN